MQSLTSRIPASLKNRLPRSRRAPHDPAPSRAVYRMQRMWLTPLYRSIMRVGVPTFLILTALGWFFSNPTNRYAIGEKITEIRRSVETRPEFMVKMMAIDGATPIVDAAIRQLLPVEFPVSSFDLDLEAIQQEVAGLDVIKTADIHIRSGGVLDIDVKERDPVMVWRRDGALELIDPEGHRVATLTARTARADLPLVVGAGANAAVPEALALFAAAGPLNDALRGLVRMGERRWDVALTSGARRTPLPRWSRCSR